MSASLGSQRDGWWPRFGALVYAVPVHLVTLAVASVAVAAVVLGDGPLRWVVAALFGLLTWKLLPRSERLRPRDAGVTYWRAESPTLVGLVDEIAAAMGMAPPTEIVVDARFNAGSMTGLRRRTLVIGGPLWVALSPRARVALLSHELGHFRSDDWLIDGVVSAARHSLERWYDVLSPPSGVQPGEHMLVALRSTGDTNAEARTVSSFTQALTWPFRSALEWYRRRLLVATAAQSRVVEARADADAIRVAGRAGVVDALEMTLAVPGLDIAANRAAVDPRRPRISESLREYAATYTYAERRRRRELPAAADASVDATHPPTLARIAAAELTAPRRAAVRLGGARSARIDDELRDVLEAATAALGESYRYVR